MSDDNAGMRVLRPLVAVGLLIVALAACSGESGSSLPRPSKAFCLASFKYDDRLPKIIGNVKAHIALVEPIAANAPKDIKADAELVLDALRRVQAGDTSVVDNPKIRKAEDNVNRRAAAGCDLYKQDPGNSGI
jgi:hypothetical protein